MSEQGIGDWGGGEQTVTASDLVRQFGFWQEAATRAPVYVLHRGRARLVLASVDLMAALCAPHTGDAARHLARERALLDALADPALMIDDALHVTAIGRTARGYFGERAVERADLAAILPGDAAPFVTAAARRAIASGIAERVELRSAPHGRRRLELSIDPIPGGALLLGRDRSVEDERDAALATADATLSAVSALPGLASARVGLRGYLDDGGSLGVLAGLAPAALASVRFVALFDLASRVAIGDALESIIADGATRTVAALLLVNRGEPVPVRIALSACRHGPVIAGVLVLVAADGTGFRDA